MEFLKRKTARKEDLSKPGTRLSILEMLAFFPNIYVSVKSGG